MSSELIRQAFEQLYPGKMLNLHPVMKYSAKFSNYGANVRRYLNVLEFRLSYDWKTVNDEIKMGLIQELMLKVFKDRIKTMNIDLYNNFLKNIHIAIPKTSIDPELSESFDGVNEQYFSGMLEKPNLVWGNTSRSKLGMYNYRSDVITISSIFKQIKDQRFVDYVMYHEMLHKKFKFSSNEGRNSYHSPEFKKAEKRFENSVMLEAEMKKKLRYVRMPRVTRSNRIFSFLERIL